MINLLNYIESILFINTVNFILGARGVLMDIIIKFHYFKKI